MTVIDQSKAIVFVDTNGVQHVLSLPRPEDCDLSIEEIAAKDVPAGLAYEIKSIVDIVFPEEPPPDVPKVPTVIASAKLSISEGMISGFAADSAIAGGFALDTGKFLMFFGAPQPDIDYIVSVFDGGLYRCYVQPDDYSVDGFTVTTTDLAGTPADPACVSIIIMRAI